jgi:WD40 repeat protein
VTQVLAFSPDGSILATGSSKGIVRLWDVATVQASSRTAKTSPPTPFAELKHEGAITAIAFSPVGGTLAVAWGEGGGHLWRLQGHETPQLTKMDLRDFPGPTPGGLQFSGDGQHLLAVSEYGFGIWDLRTRTCHYRLGEEVPWLRHATLSPDGRAVVTSAHDGSIQWWDLATWTSRSLGSGTLWPVRSLAITPDGRTVISGSRVPIRRGITQQALPAWVKSDPVVFHNTPWQKTSEGLLFWDTATGEQRPGLSGPLTMAPGEQIVLSRDGRTLAAGCPDGSAWLWDMPQSQRPRRFFVSKEAEQYIHLMETGRVVSAQPNYTECVKCLDIAPDGKTLALASTKGAVTLWDIPSGALRYALPEAQPNITWICFSPDGASLAHNAGGQVRFRDVPTGALTKTLGEFTDPQSECGAFSPDGALLVSGTRAQTLRNWALATATEKPPLVAHLGPVRAVAFSPDGKTLASGSEDRTVRLWSVAAWREVAVLEGHQGTVTCLAFAPKGEFLLSGGEGNPGELFCWRAGGDSRER